MRAIKSNKLLWDNIKKQDEPIFDKLRHVEIVQGEDQKKRATLTLIMQFHDDQEFFEPV